MAVNPKKSGFFLIKTTLRKKKSKIDTELIKKIEVKLKDFAIPNDSYTYLGINITYALKPDKEYFSNLNKRIGIFISGLKKLPVKETPLRIRLEIWKVFMRSILL